jgi:hypothetical protein
MNVEKFSNLLDRRIQLMKQVLASKGGEYAVDGDRLHNFKRAAELLRTNQASALLGMLTKHLVSVIDIIDNIKTKKVTRPLIDEKLGDCQNYFVLLEAILVEEFNLDAEK